MRPVHYFLSVHLLLMVIVSSQCCFNITVAVIAERLNVLDYPFAINRTSGLINIAINKSRDMLSGVANMNFIVVPCDVEACTALKWGAFFSELYHKHKPDAVIGPGCTPAVETISRMAVSWNIPHLTYVGTGESLVNKKEFSMLTRLSYTNNMFARFYIELFDTFGWTYIANIYDSYDYLNNLVGTSFQRTFEDEAKHVTSYPIRFNPKAANIETELLQTLREAALKSRVFIVACHGDVFRQMVLLARQVDNLEEGEYLFIFIFMFEGNPLIGEYVWKRGDLYDNDARIAYESVMVTRPRRPITQEFLDFENEVKERAFTEYNYTWKDGEEVNIYNIGHYDAFILYAHALNETISSNEDPRDGSVMIQKMWNRTFPGIGGRVSIDSNGDRDTDFTLLDLNPDTGEFQAVAQHLGWKSRFEFIDGVRIHWPNNAAPPSNVPPCGFEGELCISFSLPQYAYVAISLGCVIFVVIIAGGAVYRRMKAEAAIHSEWWRVRAGDISTITAASLCSLPRNNFEDARSFSLAIHITCLPSVGIYRGTDVYIRKPQIKSITVDRALLLELKQMHDMTCQNLTRLIGICPDANNVCILTEYCSRGTIQDILQNESIQLDLAFKISLINDIVEGMHYLHTCPVAVHGRLTSSRCVIDSRFVLKITGFGLKSIKDVRSNYEYVSNTYAHMRELLWMSPESLREYPERKYSQAGDVYSFGIILSEMCTRNEPYVTEEWYISLGDTLDKIKSEREEPLRPTLKEDGVHDEIILLAIRSWQENPTRRPSFSNIRQVLSQIRTQRGTPDVKNVLDVLLNRMEQYANNLEGLVAERTHQFLEEKKKSEELLHQVLPKIHDLDLLEYFNAKRSVAEELLSGRTVQPEVFDSVTVYFSDIVGFTTIAAQCSPFQVVAFLNDLYTCFDTIIDKFDVYKVETIGDAYMVVSGLPKRNGIDHARQIARMSLKILESAMTFTIRHRPQTPLKARIGIHSGSVCAGVVGRKMPRYCLFGDTVNTASRMESYGEAMRIHISQDTNTLLDEIGHFVIENRDIIDIKGKGPMKTFWLIDEIARSSFHQCTGIGGIPEVSC